MALSKKQQIEAQLQKYGVAPNESHVNAVIEILKGDGRASVPSAVKRYLQSFKGSTANEKSAPNGSTDVTSNAYTQQAVNVKESLKKSMKHKILTEAFSEMLSELQEGDFGDFSEDDLAIDIDFTEVFSAENFSLSLPPALPHSEQKLLPSTEEIFDAEVMPR